MTDTSGRVYIDCLSGAGALPLGHVPMVFEALQRALAEALPWETLDLTTPGKDRFVADFFADLPEGLARMARVQFCSPSGGDTVEIALKLVETATGRRSVIAFPGAYHGMTHGAVGLTGKTAPKRTIAGSCPRSTCCLTPMITGCPFGIGGSRAHRLMSRY